MWHLRFNGVYAVCIKLPEISPLHQLEDLVGSGLKRNMEVRNKTLRLRYERNDFIREKIWFNRRYTEPLDSIDLVQCLRQVNKSLNAFTILNPEVAGINSCQHDLLHFSCCNLIRRLQNVFNTVASAIPACQRYRTKCA